MLPFVILLHNIHLVNIFDYIRAEFIAMLTPKKRMTKKNLDHRVSVPIHGHKQQHVQHKSSFNHIPAM